MRLSKVLMDGGSSLNILYIDTLEAMAYPVGNLDLPVTFGSRANYRTETLTFDVLKLLGPNGVITVSGSFEHAYASSHEHFDLATTAANPTELGQLRAATTECRPDPCKPSQAPTLVSTEKTKSVVVDDTDPTKMVRVGSQLSAK
ncbi:uncharacterized protein LOC120674942 [Panicum virgatum]|uniref:uncharacterized protein LOC120674942 n=1 Tax=Panicum virgatum TaxID=38727 RepID=UPI0019D67664|nr:uncharacterized protein LOC120674942 [Panicum virgatum]